MYVWISEDLLSSFSRGLVSLGRIIFFIDDTAEIETGVIMNKRFENLVVISYFEKKRWKTGRNFVIL